MYYSLISQISFLKNYHKLDGLKKQHKFIIFELWRSEVPGGSHWAKSLFLLKAPRENPFLCHFQLSEAAHLHWLMASCIFKVSNKQPVESFFYYLILTLTFLPPSSIIKGCLSLHWTPQIIPDYCLILRAADWVILIPSAILISPSHVS